MAGTGGAKKVLIGGGTGFVGGQLAHRLNQCGYHPIILGRAFDEQEFKMRRGQLMTNSELQRMGRIPKDTLAVVNLAGATIGKPWPRWSPRYKEAVQHSRIYTTAFLRDMIAQTPEDERPKAFICSSAVGIYPPSKTAEYNEYSKINVDPSDFFQKLCLDWESAGVLPENIDPKKTRHVTVRIGLVMGRTGGIIQQSLLPFRLGLGGPMGSGSQWFPWVHVDDVCGIIVHSIENDYVDGVLNAVAPPSNTNKEFATAFAKALGRPAIFPMPGFVVSGMFGGERAKMFLSGQNVSPKRTTELKYEFMYPDLESCMREAARSGLTNEELLRLKSTSDPMMTLNIVPDGAKPGTWHTRSILK